MADKAVQCRDVLTMEADVGWLVMWEKIQGGRSKLYRRSRRVQFRIVGSAKRRKINDRRN